MGQVIVDVREDDEFQAESIPNSVHIPLSHFDSKAPAILRCLAGQDVVLMCRSGKRAKLAADRIPGFRLDGAPRVSVYQGGILEWKAKGNAIECARSSHFPIMRQVQLVAGLLVLTGTLASVFVSPPFVYLAMFVGGGLAFAGLTGICLMAKLLAKMPWNRSC